MIFLTMANPPIHQTQRDFQLFFLDYLAEWIQAKRKNTEKKKANAS